MLTLLIEDRRHGTDELAEVRVPLKAADGGHFWADAKQVCAALQSGPSRPAKVLTMRGKYRQTFLRISAEGEETNQSANLKVNADRTLPIIVESVRTLVIRLALANGHSHDPCSLGPPNTDASS
ncbi:hypothetical protein EDB87DRAFT_1568580 [Lactarius vividus]|nr:hypothetical protein EDB87DRAFT_1568580 [Lactarius vividus]